VFQITGRFNYARVSTALFGTDSLLLDSPEKLAEPETAARSAGWFWNWRGLNCQADQGDVLGCTRRINGGTNGIAERLALYKRACYALGVQ